MVSKKKLINNSSITNTVSLFYGAFAARRALVLDRSLSGLEAIPVKDFYDVVILETREALSSVPEPDFLFYKDASPYEGFVLIYPEVFLEGTILVSNYNAVELFTKLNRSIEASNVNYLPSGAEAGTQASIVRHMECGLNVDTPGVHFALLSGCTTIYYTGTSGSAIQVGLSDIQAFVTAPSRLSLANLIKPGRQTILTEGL